MAAVEVRVLGPLEVAAANGRVELPGKHARLLATLVVAGGRALSVDELVEAVWDGAPPASARKLVQVYVSQLRKALPPGVEIATRGSAYAAELEPDVLDAARFERLVAECTAAREAANPALALSLADRALSLWRGRAYGELAYEDVWRGESDRLEELRLVVVEERLDALLALGRHGEALGEAVAVTDEHPFRERAHELAMLALYRSGRQSDALEHFATARVRLHDELGLEPGPALRDLQRRILQQDPELGSGVSTSAAARALPAAPNPLVGRKRELELLVRMLERRDARLVVLTGAGGSGKTRLALEAARVAAHSYANGAVFVELAPIRDPELVAPTIAHALEVQVDEDPTGALATALEPLDLLLVVDNAEHVREAAPLYVELLARASHVTLLVTSRAVLHVSGEHVLPVSPLLEDAAVELFAQRARAADGTFELTASNEEDVREICRRVDGLPLGIELAASRIRSLTIRTLRERIDERLGLLTGGPRDLPARQQTLRETIDWSVDLLGERERRALARLSVFPGGAKLDAAEAVCDADLDTLQALVDDNLVRRDATTGEPRFDMLETVREYAREILGEERQASQLAMAAYLADVADEVEVEARARAQALSRLDPEIDNIRAALDACGEAGAVELELRLAGGIWRYWWVRGAAAEGLRRIERTLDAAGDGAATVARARALRGAAGLAWVLGDLERAKGLALEAIPAAVEAGSTWDEIAANTVMGVVSNVQGDRVLARHHHRRSMELSEQLGLEPFVQKLNLGVIALDEGDYAEARAMFEDVLAIHRRNENVEGIGTALLNLGVVHHALGAHDTSLCAFAEAQECFEAIGFPAHVAHALQGLAAHAASEGRHDEAARLLGRARADLDDVGAPEDDFAGDMVTWTKEGARKALGDEAFEAAYEAGRSPS